jgi:uncharacterized protein YjbI with pentapeptide repeats
MTVTKVDIMHVLEQHQLWLESRGVRGTKAKLTGLTLTGVVLDNKDLSHIEMESSTIIDCSFRRCNFSFAHAPHSVWKNTDLFGTRMTCSSLRESHFTGCDLTSSNLYFSTGADSMWYNCSFDRAILKNADFTRTKFINSPLDQAYLCDTILTGATLRDKEAASVHYINKRLIKRG